MIAAVEVSQLAEEADELPEHVRQLYEDNSKDLTSDQCTTLKKLLGEFNDVFAKHTADFGRTKLLKHAIDRGNKPPVKQRPRRFPRQSAKELKRQITGMAEKRILRPSTSSWALNALLVRKKDGT